MNGLGFKMRKVGMAGVLVLCFVGSGALASVARGAGIPEDQAIRAIIGEASGEGYQGMLAVAAAIRNRGHLRGVYGVRAPHVNKEPAWVWNQARKAWAESVANDPTNGADHWESMAFKTPAWAKDMKITYRHKQHVFYKSNR